MSDQKPSFLHYLEYAGWWTYALVLKLLPRRAIVAFADFSGYLTLKLWRIRRSTVLTQLQECFGARMSEKELDRLAVRSYQNLCLTFFEFIQPSQIGRDPAHLFESSCGSEILDRLRGRAAIIVTGHLGNWEAVGGFFPRAGIPLVALVKPLHNPLVNGDVMRRRLALGMEVLSVDTSLKLAIDAARKGKWLGFVADQDARRAGIFVDFMGKPASTAIGAALFSWKLNLPIVPVFCVRNQEGLRRLTMHICEPIVPDPNAERDTEILRLTAAHTQALESFVQQHPEDYFWFHRRWKTQPKRRRPEPKQS